MRYKNSIHDTIADMDDKIKQLESMRCHTCIYQNACDIEDTAKLIIFDNLECQDSSQYFEAFGCTLYVELK